MKNQNDSDKMLEIYNGIDGWYSLNQKSDNFISSLIHQERQYFIRCKSQPYITNETFLLRFLTSFETPYTDCSVLRDLVIIIAAHLQELAINASLQRYQLKLVRFNLINPPKYLMRNTPWSNGFSTPHLLHENRSHVIFGITSLNFHQSSASLSFRITNVGTFNNITDPKHLGFRVTILNETVLYTIRLDVALIQDDDIQEIYLKDKYTLNCQVMNQGIGYRSENFTFLTSVANGNNNFFPQARKIYAALYYRGFNLFNPNGSYFHLNWQFYYNFTHYTVVFHTQDQNLVSFIDFGIILVDLFNVYELNDYSKYFFVDMVNCSAIQVATCPGKAQWLFNNYEPAFSTYLFGLTKLNFTKHQPTDWEFDTSNIALLNPGYVETKSLIWVNMTVFIIGSVTCTNPANLYNPQTQTCVASCPATGSLYQFAGVVQGTAQGLCKKCHYSCPPGHCSGPASNQCDYCDASMFRQDDGSNGCKCMNGHVDVKTQYCPSCSYYTPGCIQCDAQTICTQCNTNMQLTANKTCVCTLVQTTTRNGTCPGIVGCLVYFNDSVRNSVCIQCNITQNFVLFNYSCNCIAGYSLQSIGGKWVCMPLTEVCGDGIRTISEQCDDFNIVNGDGCNSTCGIEIGYQCVGNLRETSFCIQNISTLKYMGAMKLSGQDTVDLYFELHPYNIGFDKNTSLFEKYMNISTSNISSMTLVQIFTQPYFPNDTLRIQLRYDYTEDIDPAALENMTLLVYDRSKQFKFNTSFYIVGTNLRLNVLDSYGDLIPLNYVMLVLVILAFLVMFITLFTQNWIGIELLHTFQFCFFYYVLLQDIDERQMTYLSFLQFCNGFNRIPFFMSYYEYDGFNRKIYLMNFAKQIILNFNFTALLLCVPLILFTVKLFRKLTNYYQTTRRHRDRSEVSQIRSRSPKLDYILSSEFIIGRVFVTFNLIFMNVIIFSFFVNQTHLEQENQAVNDIFQEFYIFALLSSILITVGMLTIAALQPFRYDEVSLYEDDEGVNFIRFKRFSSIYPIVYTSVIGMKIILVALFYSDSYSPYILLAVEILYFIGFLVVRPYRRIRSQEGRYCYPLHNLHNLWNSVGLIGLISVMIIANSKDNSGTSPINTAIKFIIFAIEIISLIFAYMRLFVSRRLGRIAKDIQKEKEVEKDNFEGFDLQNTDRTLRRNTSGLKKESVENKSISRIAKVQEQKIANRTRQPTGKSLSRDNSQSRVRQTP